MNKHIAKLRSDFIGQIKEIIAQAQNNAVRAIDYQRVLMYWNSREKNGRNTELI